MPARQLPTQFTVTRDCVIDGNLYNREDTISAADAAAFRSLNRLVARRILLPNNVDSTARVAQTQNYGFGSPPRDISRPVSFSPEEIAVMAGG